MRRTAGRKTLDRVIHRFALRQLVPILKPSEMMLATPKWLALLTLTLTACTGSAVQRAEPSASTTHEAALRTAANSYPIATTTAAATATVITAPPCRSSALQAVAAGPGGRGAAGGAPPGPPVRPPRRPPPRPGRAPRPPRTHPPPPSPPRNHL